MATYDVAYLKEAHKASIFHQNEILQSEACGCFYWISTFSPDKIEHLAVTDKEFLAQMNKHWF